MSAGERVCRARTVRRVSGNGWRDRSPVALAGRFATEHDSRASGAGRSTDARLTNTTGLSDLTPDQLRKLYESRKASISPEYRKHVEAYLRAISENAPTEDD